LIDNEDNAISRALLDFERASKSVQYTFDIGIEALATSRGEIALLSYFHLNTATQWTRVASVDSSTVITVEDSFSGVGTPDDLFGASNVFDLEDLVSYGVTYGLSIRSAAEGSIIQEISASDEANKTITISDTTDVVVGDLVAIGPVGRINQRVVVTNIEFKDKATAKVTCIEE